MTPTERTGGTRVRLYVRETLPAPAAARREAVTEDLRSLAADGRVDDCEVVPWPKRIPAAERDSDLGETVAGFQAWARERGVSLTPFFGFRKCYSMDTGEKEDWLVLPALCLAVYEDGDLASVYPHGDGTTHRSVLDALDALADADAAAADPTRPMAPGTAD